MSAVADDISSSIFMWFCFLTSCVQHVLAPSGRAVLEMAAAPASAVTLGTGAALVASAAAAWALRTKAGPSGPSTHRRRVAKLNKGGTAPGEESSDSGGGDDDEDSDIEIIDYGASSDDDDAGQSSDDSDADDAGRAGAVVDSDDCSDVENDLVDEDCDAAVGGGELGIAPRTSNSGKLWGKAQFPEGCIGLKNAKMDNLLAAQAWECPCDDRNCLSADRIDVIALSKYREHFRNVQAAANGGLRDACRKEMEEHYDERTNTFTRSFKIGPCADCCVAAAGLAKGLSFDSWAKARADVRLPDRPYRAERNAERNQHESEQRAHLAAWIRDEIEAMEGPKGGSDPVDKVTTPYMSGAMRWAEYCKARRSQGLPIIGSERLFREVWAKSEIHEVKSKGHAKCNRCGQLAAEEDKYKGRKDAEGLKNLERVRELKAVHKAGHRKERNYQNDFWTKAERYPSKITAFSMDAPTERQFDVPMQQRNARDVVKSLEKAKRWSSKITGLMIAGLGILAYVTRSGLGSGADLSCTILYLGLLQLVRLKHPIGASLLCCLTTRQPTTRIMR